MESSKKIILGIDPGSRCTGYGIIWAQGSQYGCITYGQIRTKGNEVNQRLQQIQQGLLEVIETHHPNEASIEQIFTCHNPKSALKLGQARGAALAATATHNLPIAEYSARKIKLAVVGYGAATKTQVQHMISMLLKLPTPPQADAADALAIALCHAHIQRYQQHIDRGKITAGAAT